MNPGSPIFNIFGRSPIKPLQKHSKTVHLCTQELLPFFTAVLDNDWKKSRKIQQRISDLETQADDIKKSLRLHLPESLFLPIARTAILELLTVQDKLANKSEDIAGLIVGRQMQIPQIMAKQFIKFLKRCIDASEQAYQAINELDELLDTGFRGKEVVLVERMITELNDIEHDTDEMQINMRKCLFELENQLPPIEVMFLYKILEWTGDLADHAQSIGSKLLLILAR